MPSLAASIGKSSTWASAAVVWELAAAVLLAGWKAVPLPTLSAPSAAAPDAMDVDEEEVLVVNELIGVDVR